MKTTLTKISLNVTPSLLAGGAGAVQALQRLCPYMEEERRKYVWKAEHQLQEVGSRDIGLRCGRRMVREVEYLFCIGRFLRS